MWKRQREKGSKERERSNVEKAGKRRQWIIKIWCIFFTACHGHTFINQKWPKSEAATSATAQWVVLGVWKFYILLSRIILRKICGSSSIFDLPIIHDVWILNPIHDVRIHAGWLQMSGVLASYFDPELLAPQSDAQRRGADTFSEISFQWFWHQRISDSSLLPEILVLTPGYPPSVKNVTDEDRIAYSCSWISAMLCFLPKEPLQKLL